MRYWWVNQNQTYAFEVPGGFLWSPKTRADGARNYFYQTMEEVRPGDLVFSYYETQIQAIGIVQRQAVTAPKPNFRTAGSNWEVFHTPKNLSMAIAGEAGELVSEFQWLTAQESMKDSLSSEKLSDIEMEIADVAIYLFRLADVLGVDLADVMRKKMVTNESRF